MVTEVAIEAPAVAPNKRRDFGSSARLWGGFFGRAWLWFLAGCLVVTFVPMLFGWRPYVVESGSMLPRIKVGDVILASPEHNEQKLLGHVTVFEDPDPSRAGTVKSHRVISINKDGTMVTKGDANPTPDPVALPLKNVKGIGRLLVRWIGLPLIWVQTGQWIKLGLLVFSLWLAAFLVVRDQDEPIDDEDADDESGGDDGDDEPDDDTGDGDETADATWGFDQSPRTGVGPRHLGQQEPDAPLQWKPRASGLRRFRRARHRQPLSPAEFARAFGVRAGIVVVAAAGLLIPTTQAAFSATTSNTVSTWATASVFGPNYTLDTESLHPYLYWKIDDATGASTAVDSSGNNRPGTYSPTASWSLQQVGGLVGQAPNYAGLATGGVSDTTSCVYSASGVAAENPAPATYSEIIWFKTAAGYNGGGKLIGFESEHSGVSNSNSGGQYDRHIYMDGNGKIVFGVWTGATTTVNSTQSYNDGSWHMAVATMGSDGMKLYVDNVLVGTSTNTQSQDYTATNGGWWRVGCGNLEGWGGTGAWSGPNAPGTTQTNYGFAGDLDEATVYTTELTAANVAQLYQDIVSAPLSPVVVNSGFESSPALTGWTCTGGTADTSTHHANSGNYSLELQAPANGTATCSQTLQVTTGHAYTLAAYLRGTNVTLGVSGGATASQTFSPGNNMRQESISFTATSSGTVTIYVQTSGTTGFFGNSNTIYADDFSVTP
jgi:signal peptidase I